MARATFTPSETFRLSTYQKPAGRGSRAPRLVPAGSRHGRLTATDEFGLRQRPDGRNRCFQKFLCDCGEAVFAIPGTVTSGNTSSCGCAHSETVRLAMTTHGATVDRESPEYRLYRAQLQHRRRARIHATALTLISPQQFAKLVEEHGGKCWICDVEPPVIHWDHVQPLAKGGTHTVDNLRPSCPPCNSRKGDIWPFSDEDKNRIADEVRALRTSPEPAAPVRI